MEIVVPSKLRRVRIRISSRTSRIRVSNELGAGNPQVAKLAVYVIVGIAVAQGIVVVTVLLSVRKVLGRAFSSDPKIISYAASMIPIVACGNFLDGLQCVLSGVARGCGWQKIGACVNLGSYYLVGVPLGLLLGFHFHIGGRILAFQNEFPENKEVGLLIVQTRVQQGKEKLLSYESHKP
ncbi:BnaC06g23470D [Brassica napus]|uniref:Protein DETOXIFICATION n=3 Tax=Brassica TaxID=3705 RepID=A0A3P6HAS0_BRAOL|nr:unnamed protein product [Brassica napus]CDY11095.1 BnaC06g23470D [Brassica napus]VDD63049.1 unnamed protein product [Brassica oleracea]